MTQYYLITLSVLLIIPIHGHIFGQYVHILLLLLSTEATRRQHPCTMDLSIAERFPARLCMLNDKNRQTITNKYMN